MRHAYVNGRYVPHAAATVHIEDRGYQFADGVYEVVTVLNGRMVDEKPHMDRLERSLRELDIAMPTTPRAMGLIARELARRNRLRNGLIYLQVTRGVAPRNHAYPKGPVRPALVMTTKAMDFANMAKFRDGVSVITTPDARWARRDIKTINLLPNCIAKQKAAEAGCYEAWMVDGDGMVTEGSSSNAWILTRDNTLVTRPLSNDILHGITRRTLLRLAAEEGIPVEERPFTVAEACEAREAFVSSATSFATPVVKINDRALGNGRPGSFTEKLLNAYLKHAAAAGSS